MSYTPTVWASGDIVTSTKLNKLENGVASAGGGGGAFIVHMNAKSGALDKTWQEIHDAALTGIVYVVLSADDGVYPFVPNGVYISDGTYEPAGYRISSPGGVSSFSTDSANGYPIAEEFDNT